MVLKKILAVFLSASIVVLSGCSVSPVENKKDSLVAVSFYPVYIFTLNLLHGIDDVRVECMAEQSTGCLHDYTLTARDAKLLSDAQAFVINGAGMETFLHDIEDSVDDICIIDSSENVEIICSHAHEEGENNNHNHSHEGNAHIWMSVENAKKQVKNIKNGLIEIFPLYKEKINSNCSEYLEKLSALSDDIQFAGKYLKNKDVITFHNAYEYMAKDMGFKVVHTVESHDGGEPSAKKLAFLCKEIKQKEIKTLLVEPDYKGSAPQILSAETGVEIYVVNPVISGEVTLTAYEDTMRKNIEILKKAVK